MAMWAAPLEMWAVRATPCMSMLNGSVPMPDRTNAEQPSAQTAVPRQK